MYVCMYGSRYHSYNYTCIGINVSYTITGSVSDTTFSVTLLGLTPFSEYTCNVSAITSNGIGTSSNVRAITKQTGRLLCSTA